MAAVLAHDEAGLGLIPALQDRTRAEGAVPRKSLRDFAAIHRCRGCALSSKGATEARSL